MTTTISVACRYMECICRSESCAVVMLASTWSDSDNPCALMLGSAVNQDGRASSLTAPNGPSQASVIREAVATARVETAVMQNLHLHGTGTSLVSCCFCTLPLFRNHFSTHAWHHCMGPSFPLCFSCLQMWPALMNAFDKMSCSAYGPACLCCNVLPNHLQKFVYYK